MDYVDLIEEIEIIYFFYCLKRLKLKKKKNISLEKEISFSILFG